MMNVLTKPARVMSFNVLCDYGQGGLNSWDIRKESVISLILFHNPDIIGVQEPLPHQMDYLMERLPEYAYVGAGRDDGQRQGEFAAVIYKIERYNLLDSGNFWLSETPEVPGSRGWDAACVRIASWAKLYDTYMNRSIFVINTHFDHEGVVAIRESAVLLRDMIAELANGLPVIVTGDFNSQPDSQAYSILTGYNCVLDPGCVMLNDSHVCTINGHYGPDFTYHDFRADIYFSSLTAGDQPPMLHDLIMRIDYIFLNRSFRVLRHGTICDHKDGRFPSDHFPVIADIEYMEA